MKKNKSITIFFIVICIISFSAKICLNNLLQKNIQNIKVQELKNLDFKTNKNFVKFGIENIGNALRDELIKMDVDNCDVKLVESIPFYLFQEIKVDVSNSEKTITIYFKYDWVKNLFKIRGFQNE